MAGVYSRIGLGLGFRLGVGTAPPHGRCETKYDSPGSCLSRPQSERIYSHWCAAYAGRQLLATADCEHTSTPPPTGAQHMPTGSYWPLGTTRDASPSGTSSPARSACASSTGEWGRGGTDFHTPMDTPFPHITSPPLLASTQQFNDASPNQVPALPPPVALFLPGLRGTRPCLPLLVLPLRAERYETMVDCLLWLPLKGKPRRYSAAGQGSRGRNSVPAPLEPEGDPALTDSSPLSNAAPMVSVSQRPPPFLLRCECLVARS